MTSDRIQKWLAGLAAQRTITAAEREALEIIAFLAAPDGALQLADEAARERIMSECRACECDGHVWSETGLAQLTLDLEPDAVAGLSAAIRYLGARGLAIAHPRYPQLVRFE